MEGQNQGQGLNPSAVVVTADVLQNMMAQQNQQTVSMTMELRQWIGQFMQLTETKLNTVHENMERLHNKMNQQAVDQEESNKDTMAFMKEIDNKIANFKLALDLIETCLPVDKDKREAPQQMPPDLDLIAEQGFIAQDFLSPAAETFVQAASKRAERLPAQGATISDHSVLQRDKNGRISISALKQFADSQVRTAERLVEVYSRDTTRRDTLANPSYLQFQHDATRLVAEQHNVQYQTKPPKSSHIYLYSTDTPVVIWFYQSVKTYHFLNNIRLKAAEHIDRGICYILIAEQVERRRRELRKLSTSQKLNLTDAEINEAASINDQQFAQCPMEEVINWLQIHVRPPSNSRFVLALKSTLDFRLNEYDVIEYNENLESIDIDIFLKVYQRLLAYRERFNNALAFLSANNESNIPKLHEKGTGLISIFLSAIYPKSYARTVHVSAMRTLAENTKFSSFAAYLEAFFRQVMLDYTAFQTAENLKVAINLNIDDDDFFQTPRQKNYAQNVSSGRNAFYHSHNKHVTFYNGKRFSSNKHGSSHRLQHLASSDQDELDDCEEPTDASEYEDNTQDNYEVHSQDYYDTTDSMYFEKDDQGYDTNAEYDALAEHDMQQQALQATSQPAPSRDLLQRQAEIRKPVTAANINRGSFHSLDKQTDDHRRPATYPSRGVNRSSHAAPSYRDPHHQSPFPTSYRDDRPPAATPHREDRRTYHSSYPQQRSDKVPSQRPFRQSLKNSSGHNDVAYRQREDKEKHRNEKSFPQKRF